MTLILSLDVFYQRGLWLLNIKTFIFLMICRIHMFGIPYFRIFHHGDFGGEGRLWKHLQRCDRHFFSTAVNESFPVCFLPWRLQAASTHWWSINYFRWAADVQRTEERCRNHAGETERPSDQQQEFYIITSACVTVNSTGFWDPGGVNTRLLPRRHCSQSITVSVTVFIWRSRSSENCTESVGREVKSVH